jgi:outer membrane murein-binding lipoprotein Lpp
MEAVLTILLSIIGSSAVFGFIQFMIARKDQRESKLDKLSTKVDAIDTNVKELKTDVKEQISELSEKMEENDEVLRQQQLKINADTRRVRILRGSDEIRMHVKHSEEWFDQTNEDITEYEKYCEEHPGYKNNKAVHAIQNINQAYEKALKDNDFL